MQMGTEEMALSAKCSCKLRPYIVSLASKGKVWLHGAHLQPQWGSRDRCIPSGLMASQATLINEPRVPKQNKVSKINLAIF